MKIISRGAEALLYIDDGKLVKERISKGYRIKEIDNRLRKMRTRSEAKLLEKTGIANVPRVYDYSDKEMKIVMEYIDGKLVRDIIDNLDDDELKQLCEMIGRQIAVLHKENVIHGDLTTSNMIEKDNKVYIIDFGLGFINERIEDKAVDLRLLRQALESKHYKIGKKAFSYIERAYAENYKDGNRVIERLEKRVERRGRYKRKKKIS